MLTHTAVTTKRPGKMSPHSLPPLDPISPAFPPSSHPSGFNTLHREYRNRHPSPQGMDHPALEQLVRPHIASFDALTESLAGGGSVGEGKGLLDLGLEELTPKCVFDGKKGGGKFGNKITCMFAMDALHGVQHSCVSNSRLMCDALLHIHVGTHTHCYIIILYILHSQILKSVAITGLTLSRPLLPDRDRVSTERRIFPVECRERLTTYKARLGIKVRWTYSDGKGGDEQSWEEWREGGGVPIMVKVGCLPI